jgi:hypothetical protein
MRFLQHQAGVQKKKQQIADLCTLVAFTLTSPLKRLREAEASKAIKTVAGLPDGDSNVFSKDSFYRCSSLGNCVEIVNPIALGL